MERTTPGVVLEPMGAHAPPLTWRLHVVASPDRRWRGRIFTIGPNGCILGRSPDAAEQAQMDDPLLSRSHVELRPGPRADLLDVRDLGSRNGTFRSAQRIAMTAVGHDAVLRLGSTVAVVQADLGLAQAFDHPTPEVPGRSMAARRIREALQQAAQGDAPVLIQGPTGSGKEFAVHELHRRAGCSGAIVHVSAPALAENAFEVDVLQQSADNTQELFLKPREVLAAAAGGLLVLDEIAELRPTHQARLLRVLETGGVRPAGLPDGSSLPIRFVATTNADLEARVRDGRFRRDLLARLRAHVVALPPLRARRADLLEWADVILPLKNQQFTSWSQALAPDALEALLLHDWPENLRELRAALQYLAGQLDAAPLPLHALPPNLHDQRASGALSAALTPDADVLRRLLARHYGNVAKLARHFGRDRRQIYRWLDRAGIGEEEMASHRRGE